MNYHKRSSNYNLYSHLFEKSADQYVIELLQYEINKRIYYYGDHYINSWETKPKSITRLKEYFARFYKKIKVKSFKSSSNLVISNAYFSINDILTNHNFEVVIPWWSLKKTGFYLKDKEFLKLYNDIEKILREEAIHSIVSDDFLEKVKSLRALASDVVQKNKIKAGFFANDLGFFERVFIDALKENGIPSFIFLHGLPGRYNSIDDNRADYLLVWGEKIKQNYIDAGVNSNKIVVTGHPSYKRIKKRELSFSLESILVISKPNNGTPAISDNIFLSDRGNSILYLERVGSILKSLGVRNVRLRLHPSENVAWYAKNIDSSLFTIDNSPLYESISKSTLVIGPSSTVILDSVYSGVNYLVFEPSDEGFSLMNYPIVSPFNGKDLKIPVASNEEDFIRLIKQKTAIDPTVFHDYIAPEFNFSEVMKIIEQTGY